jgi:NAD-dependent dihydropyrimidine dehydrogenase PreA subunit
MQPEMTLVVSQSQSQHPAKRAREYEIADRLCRVADWNVLVVPHLYDLNPEGPVLSELRSVSGHLIVFAWLYPRAAHWVLHRHGVSGRRRLSQLHPNSEEEAPDREDGEAPPAGQDGERIERVMDRRPRPSRSIYCIDLRACESPERVSQEIERIRAELGDGRLHPATGGSAGNGSRPWRQIAEQTERRWYPVIDFSLCTNCMECIDFCLFGVYGIDRFETILVEQPDNCRKGCPACSRVCPENAIIFPQHKSPAIAGAPGTAGGLKIDLSQLFGKPEPGGSPKEIAAREREQQRIATQPGPAEPPSSDAKPSTAPTPPAADELDALLETLDDFDR